MAGYDTLRWPRLRRKSISGQESAATDPSRERHPDSGRPDGGHAEPGSLVNGSSETLRDTLTDVDEALAMLRGRLAAVEHPSASPPAASEGQDDIAPRRPGVGGLGDYTKLSPEAWLFREEVTVSAGPFVDLADVHAFAEALAALPQKPRATVWGFDGGAAEIRLTGDAPLQLADADLRSLPHSPRVEQASASALTLSFESPPVRERRRDDAPVLPLHLTG